MYFTIVSLVVVTVKYLERLKIHIINNSFLGLYVMISRVVSHSFNSRFHYQQEISPRSVRAVPIASLSPMANLNVSAAPEFTDLLSSLSTLGPS